MKKILMANSDICGVKVKLIKKIMEIIERKQWNQMKSASFLGIDQPKISQMKQGKTQGFSLERLLSFLVKLHCKEDLAKLNCEVELPIDGVKLTIYKMNDNI